MKYTRNQKQQYCNLCKKTIPSGNLSIHQQRKHKSILIVKQSKKDAKCLKCGLAVNKKSLKRHLLYYCKHNNQSNEYPHQQIVKELKDSKDLCSVVGRQKQWKIIKNKWYQFALSKDSLFIFLIYGQSGVGKTYCISQMLQEFSVNYYCYNFKLFDGWSQLIRAIEKGYNTNSPICSQSLIEENKVYSKTIFILIDQIVIKRSQLILINKLINRISNRQIKIFIIMTTDDFQTQQYLSGINFSSMDKIQFSNYSKPEMIQILSEQLDFKQYVLPSHFKQMNIIQLFVSFSTKYLTNLKDIIQLFFMYMEKLIIKNQYQSSYLTILNDIFLQYPNIFTIMSKINVLNLQLQLFFISIYLILGQENKLSIHMNSIYQINKQLSILLKLQHQFHWKLLKIFQDSPQICSQFIEYLDLALIFIQIKSKTVFMKTLESYKSLSSILAELHLYSYLEQQNLLSQINYSFQSTINKNPLVIKKKQSYINFTLIDISQRPVFIQQKFILSLQSENYNFKNIKNADIINRRIIKLCLKKCQYCKQFMTGDRQSFKCICCSAVYHQSCLYKISYQCQECKNISLSDLGALFIDGQSIINQNQTLDTLEFKVNQSKEFITDYQINVLESQLAQSLQNNHNLFYRKNSFQHKSFITNSSIFKNPFIHKASNNVELIYSKYNKGVYFPPVQLIKNTKGQFIQAISLIPINCFICEVGGDVLPSIYSKFSKNNQCIELSWGQNSYTSTYILTVKFSNLFFYLQRSQQKANCKIIRFYVKDSLKILIFSKQQIKYGEILSIDKRHFEPYKL